MEGREGAPLSETLNTPLVVILTYVVATNSALVVPYVDVSNDSSFGHVDHELTEVGQRRINLDLKDGQHIGGNRLTHNVVSSVDCLGAGVSQKVHGHVERRWQ